MRLTYTDKKNVSALEQAYVTPEMTRQRSLTLDALDIGQGARVLDAGCGTGLLTAEIATAVDSTGIVIGVDPSSEMLKIARNRCSKHSQVELKLGTVEHLDERNNFFDAVACIQVLLYAIDIGRSLREIGRVLRPGGKLVVIETDWRSAILNASNQELTTRMFACWDESVPNPNLPSRLTEFFEKNGLTSTRVDTMPITSITKPPGSFVASVIDWTATHAQHSGIVSKKEATDWLEEMEIRSREKSFFFSVNRFIFATVKPEASLL